MSNNHWLNACIAKEGYTQELLAKETGVSQSHISKIATGVTKPSIKAAKKIAAALGFDWTRFYEETP